MGKGKGGGGGGGGGAGGGGKGGGDAVNTARRTFFGAKTIVMFRCCLFSSSLLDTNAVLYCFVE